MATQKDDQNESGFHCEVCDCIVKDSLNYLDHVNGKKHNRNLGISLKKFVDCSLEEVKEMLDLKKRERDEKAYRLDYKSEQEEKKQESCMSAATVDEESEGEDDDAMIRLMGFSAFSTSKK